MNASGQRSSETSPFGAIFVILFVLGNLVLAGLVYRFFGGFPPVIDLIRFILANFSDLVILEVVFLVLALIVTGVVSRSVSTRSNRIPEQTPGAQARRDSGTTEKGGAQVEVPSIIRPTTYRPIDQAAFRTWVFLKSLLVGWAILVLIGGVVSLLALVVPISTPLALLAIVVLALVWFVWSLLVTANSFVVADYERKVLFRMGRIVGAIGPGPVQIVPIIENIRFEANVRITTPDIRFNNIPVKSSSGEGFIQIDVWLRLFLEVLDASLAVKYLQDVSSAVQAEAQIDLGIASREFTVDQVVGRVPAYLKRLEDIVNFILKDWGLKARVGVSDTLLPPDLKLAYQKAEAAEVEAKAMKILSEAMIQVSENWAQASKKVLSPEASDELKAKVFVSLVGVEVADRLAGGKGAMPVIGVSGLLSGTGLGRATPEEGS